MKPNENYWRNGVRVSVRRTENGSVVQATCQCFGQLGRVHSTLDCPYRRKRKAA